MFLGQYHHIIDNKGRLTIPARFRDLLVMEGAYIIQGFDGNLTILTAKSFQALYTKINQKSITDPSARRLRRFIFSHGDQVEIDKLGRILIPPKLRQNADLNNEVVLVGNGDNIEIWSSEKWSDQEAILQQIDERTKEYMNLDLSSD